jgi:hypothetical protein
VARGKLLLDPLACERTEPLPLRVVLEEGCEGRGERDVIAVRDEDAGVAVDDALEQGVELAGDHRLARGRSHAREPTRFGVGREDADHVGGADPR